MELITGIARLEEWLDQRGWFQDCRVPMIHSAGDAVTLRVETVVHFGTRPGAIDVVDVYEVTARQVVEYTAPTEHVRDHVVDGIDAREIGGRLCLRANLPGLLAVVCEAIEVTQLPTERRTVAAWVGGRAFSLAVGGSDLPNAEEWRGRVEELARTPVVWRVLGGRASTPAPLAYDGWFLQKPELLADVDGGVFVRWAGKENGGFRVGFERHGARDDLWRAVQLAVGAFDGVVRSGNCVFACADWQHYLRTGQLPPVERLGGTPPES